MSTRIAVLAALALICATGSAVPASSQDVTAPCRLCGADGIAREDTPATPVRLDVHASLDFDRLILAGQGEGRAEIGPEGARSVGGSVASIGARSMVGEVVIRGEAGRHVRVTLPDGIQLHGLAGGTIRLESIRADLPAMPRLDANGSLRFRFGGTVRIQGDVDGEFRGNVPIDVEYL